RSTGDAKRLFSWLEKGIPAILYGPASSLHTSILHFLSLELDTPSSGQLILKPANNAPSVNHTVSGTLIHDPVGSAGGIAATFVGGAATLHHIVSSASGERAYCVSNSVKGTPLYWLRGTNPFETRPDTSNLALKPRPRETCYVDASKLCYELLGFLGYTIEVQCKAPSTAAGQNAALMLFSRHDNAWHLSGYAAAPIGSVRLKFPDGAPLFHATFAQLEDGASLYPLARVMHHECRVFVQQKSGVIGCNTGARDEHHRELTLKIVGLEDATVVFFPPHGMAVTFENQGNKTHFQAGQIRVTQPGLSGELLIRW
ncbi:MAG: hypothetical protein JXA89_08100, partial [Anaerolineae bacterium]|nr:hypothetical protein [Anaerolineae bacterium]